MGNFKVGKLQFSMSTIQETPWQTSPASANLANPAWERLLFTPAVSKFAPQLPVSPDLLAIEERLEKPGKIWGLRIDYMLSKSWNKGSELWRNGSQPILTASVHCSFNPSAFGEEWTIFFPWSGIREKKNPQKLCSLPACLVWKKTEYAGGSQTNKITAA